MLDDDGRRPGREFIAFFLPDFLAGVFVQCGDEGLFLMIPVHDQSVPVQGWRRALAVTVLGVHLPELFPPKKFSVGLETEEAARTEIGVDAFAVGDR